jgi:hypothetical protein
METLEYFFVSGSFVFDLIELKSWRKKSQLFAIKYRANYQIFSSIYFPSHVGTNRACVCIANAPKHLRHPLTIFPSFLQIMHVRSIIINFVRLRSV